ncbi:MAG: DNA topoisomerase 4 subunit A [Eubacteriales bacterium]|nr:DNA topoisomerase 4 subunit A [Eubacteriales bacterium]
MAKSGKKNIIERLDEIIQTPLEEVMEKSMMPYAEHVILERALPRVEDGLKPVQRRILFSMHELGLTPDKPHRKCARIVGDCLGKYHPHGESSVYDALVRMAQSFSMRGMLVDGHGNFGSIDGDTAAAMRYTEARMAPLAMEMLRDIQKETVHFHLNFDDTMKEPDLLPARFPNMLVNGATGIAVGLATNIPPHNLREVVLATIRLMDKPETGLDELMEIIPAPDFPTGGVLLDTPEIREAFLTGRGKIQLRARVHIEQGKAGRHLLCITEVPYQVNKAQLLERILALSEARKAALGCIYDIRDESDRSGMRAVVEIKKDADPEAVLAYLFRYSDLQVTVGVNMVAIAGGKPVQLGLIQALEYYIAHQRDVVTRRSQYELDQAEHRAHILEGLIVAVDNLDEVIRLIRQSQSVKQAKEGLMERFSLSDIQSQAILDLRLQRLTGLEILTLRKEYEAVEKLMKRLRAILGSERLLLKLIKEELQEIADKYGDERRTMILKVDDEAEDASLPLDIPVPEETVVILTRGGQLRRLSPRMYEKLELPETSADMPRYVFQTMTDHTLLLFTQLGNCYQLPVSQLEEQSRPRERGTLLAGVLNGLEEGEECVSLIDVGGNTPQDTPDLFFFTKLGMAKRSLAEDYQVRRGKFAAIKLGKGDTLAEVCQPLPQDDLFCLTRQGMLIRFAQEDVPVMGRVTGGVRGIKLNPKDYLFWAGGIGDDGDLILASERGFMKRVPGSMVDSQKRAGKGVHSFYFYKNGSNGTYVAAAAFIRVPRSFTVETTQGQLVPVNSEEVVRQTLTERGKPYIMAVMDDVVSDIIL